MRMRISAFNYAQFMPGQPTEWWWMWSCPTCDVGDIGPYPYRWMFDQVADHVDTYHRRVEACS